MDEQELTDLVIGCCIEIHRTLGPGLLESVYEEVLSFELKEKGISFTRQQIVPVEYRGRVLEAGFRADIIVNDKIILEIKSVEKILPLHSKQLLTYLKLTQKRIGLLINFNVNLLKDGIKRIVNGY
ncbi:MAG TPA: GxxExxY protein [Leptospiraceae bacterium]|nr:GxxExxY protein [Leptospiraceae bacterium]HMY69430.1 GxxExxY protein [Leptospiraceae bacterium]HNF16514.1 GxxExxY protein [Leptospiraceae bacterium]HNM04715.1 GxxExxY protein [Leptospiraceae bacterium]